MMAGEDNIDLNSHQQSGRPQILRQHHLSAMQASICMYRWSEHTKAKPCWRMQVNKDVLIMNADRFFLEEVGAVTKADNLRKREIQVNTRMFYAQRR